MENNKKKSMIKIGGIILAVAVVIVGASFGIAELNKSRNESDKKEDNKKEEVEEVIDKNATASKTIIVPDVSEMTILEATKKLKEEGFEVDSEYDEEYSEDVEKGLVLGTDL